MICPLRTALPFPEALRITLEVCVVVAEIAGRVELVDGDAAGLAVEQPGDRARPRPPSPGVFRGARMSIASCRRSPPRSSLNCAGQLLGPDALDRDQQVPVLEFARALGGVGADRRPPPMPAAGVGRAGGRRSAVSWRLDSPRPGIDGFDARGPRRSRRASTAERSGGTARAASPRAAPRPGSRSPLRPKTCADRAASPRVRMQTPDSSFGEHHPRAGLDERRQAQRVPVRQPHASVRLGAADLRRLRRSVQPVVLLARCRSRPRRPGPFGPGGIVALVWPGSASQKRSGL